tara:strand:- start:6 stop:383 length:378 start_codon:yes stop_codon:yes gene_type:complete
MKTITPIYISPKGGAITCLNEKNNRIFQSCTPRLCRYSKDLRSAKKQLEILETDLLLEPQKVTKTPTQRKTTLKWTSDGELSAVDMARVLDRLTNPTLSQCDFACDIDDALLDKKTLKTPSVDIL